MTNKLMLLLALVLMSAAGFAQEKPAKVKSMIESKNFVFVAQSVMPMSGPVRQLTSEYDMKVTNNTLDTYLPYFGRAYQAPLDPTKGGIEFKSKDFTFDTKTKKKGWDIVIHPKDNRDVRELYLSVSRDGYATLEVTSNDRQAIRYTGYVGEAKS